MATPNSNTGGWSPAQQDKFDKLMAEMDAVTKTLDDRMAALKEKPFVQYTLFASGLRHGRMSELEGKNQTDNLAILFDSVDRHTQTKSYNKTSYAVESKAKASDHVVTQDGKFSFSGRVSDTPYYVDQRNYIDRDTDPERPMDAKRPMKAVDVLTEIADSHQLVTLVTEDNILTGYVITNLVIERSVEEGSGIVVNIDLEEFRFKTVGKTVLASRTADPKKAGSKNAGTKQTAEGGPVDDEAKGKRKTPYVGKTTAAAEAFETKMIGTTDFGGKPGAKITPSGFDPSSLLKR